MEGSSVYNCRGTSVTRIGYARILWSSRYGKCGIEGALEYFGRVGLQKLWRQGCARILWSSRYAEMVESRMR
jgi:hypothetical protein